GADDAVEDWLPVLALAELQVGRLGRARDAVALGIDQVQGGGLAADLSAQNHRHAQVDARVLALGGRVLLGTRRPATEVLGRVVHGTNRPERDRDLRIVEITSQLGEDRMRSGKVPGGQRDEHPLPGDVEDVHLAVRPDVVHPGTRARVGREDEAVVHLGCDAVRHAYQELYLPGAKNPSANDGTETERWRSWCGPPARLRRPSGGCAPASGSHFLQVSWFRPAL